MLTGEAVFVESVAFSRSSHTGVFFLKVSVHVRTLLSACEAAMDAPCSILSGRVSTRVPPALIAASRLICDS